MSTIFGGIHCIAWFFTFPTYQEQVLWHISAVAIILVPWLSMLLFFLNDILDKALIRSMFILIPPPLYITGRLILLILMFTTLRNLPPDTYQAVSWTSLVPHL
ncbi:hypothetical protein K503DRAFT_728170 [Rhizopogon vinicolor AM-OR11-026]|uniref:Uncharacterized protein n=1 Tax=Rhizopogon vinicolor AM-OR11-026 TaxID=1314800 RepID=A0A1B7ME55_9AGAM|nr:hypothetical protein K503DRAFT_728170 [Rhizopogon vinicolor AM-OR11-026]